MKSNISKYIKILFLSLIIIGSIFAGALASSVLEVIKETPPVDFSGISDSLGKTSIILDSEGNLIEELQSVDYREIKPIEEIPQHVQDAFIAVEDERFYKHNGIDLIGIARSAIDNILAGGIVRGGSTITQQLVKDLYLNDERTLDRKIKEAYIAIKMDSALTKEEILEIYLNRIFLGQNSYGVQAAAKTYFSKDIKDLSLAEAAALASLPKAPSELALYNSVPADSISEEDQIIEEVIINGDKYFAVYNPSYKDRQSFILDKLLELEKITAEEYAQASNQDILASLDPPDRQNQNTSSFVTGLIKKQVASDLMDKFNLSEDDALDMLYNGGLQITTTIDSAMQEGLTSEFESFIDTVAQGTDEYGSSTRFMNLKLDGDANILNQADEILYFDKANIYDEDNDIYLANDSYEFTDQGLRITHPALSYAEGSIIVKPFYTTGQGNLRTHEATSISLPVEDIQEAGEDGILVSKAFLESNESFYLENESGLFLSNKYFNIDEDGIIQPQSSVVVIDHSKGHIKAVIGGRETSRGLNRAYETLRQPGSTIKPLAVYLPNLDNNMTLATPIDDLPRKDEKGDLWPINWYGEYRGLTSLRASLETSSNVNAVNALEEVGLGVSKEYLAKLGLINEDHPENDHFITKSEDPNANDENTAAMALGAMNYGFTNLEMTGAYAAIANKGTYIEPTSYSQVTDRNGRVILENENQVEEVVDEQTAFLLQDAMRSAATMGVAANAQVQGYSVAGKTGTSGTENLDIDSWYIGYTPYYTVGVWMGADNQQLKINSISGITTALFSQVQSYILQGQPAKEFIIPSGIVELEVCNQSGKLPSDSCWQDHRGTIITEYFKEGNEPTTQCDTHVYLSINSSDGLLATDNTPRYNRVQKLFIQPKKEFNPKDFGGLVPTDYPMRAPTEYSQQKGFVDNIIDSIFGEDQTETDLTETQTEPPAEPPASPPVETEPNYQTEPSATENPNQLETEIVLPLETEGN